MEQSALEIVIQVPLGGWITRRQGNAGPSHPVQYKIASANHVIPFSEFLHPKVSPLRTRSTPSGKQTP